MHLCDSERKNKVKLIDQLITTTNHALVLGGPGAGKTTSMKKMVAYWLSKKNVSQQNVLLLVRFRTLSHSFSKYPIRDAMREILPFEIKYEIDGPTFYKDRLLNEALILILNSIGGMLVFEGFDEISDSVTKTNVLSELRYFVEHLREMRIIVTCRTGEFPYSIDKMDSFEIAALDDYQIWKFSDKWLGKEALKFVNEIKSSPYYDSTMRPLALAHLCAIYDRIGRIPDRPKTIYKKIVSLLLEEWDEQRSITRLSDYAHFDLDRKYEFLCHLAYELTANGIRGEFSEAQLSDTYMYICSEYGLSDSIKERKKVITEIESHTGLFLRSGYENFEFAHKSIQEYLTAEYLVKLPNLKILGESIEDLGAELAIATSISSSPSMYFTDLVLGTFPKASITKIFYDSFVNRLLVESPNFKSSKDLALAMFYILANGITEKNSHSNFFHLFGKILSDDDRLVLKNYYQYHSSDVETGTISVERVLDHRLYKLKKKLTFRALFDEVMQVYNTSSTSLI